MMTLEEVLALAAEMKASDVHLTADLPPLARVDGELVRLEGHAALTSAEIERLLDRYLKDHQKRLFEETSELDFSVGIRDVARIRVNVFRQRGQVAAVLRLIPDQIPVLRELGLPAVVETLVRIPRGLVLVTGPTGSGKTTTLAAIIDQINSERRSHILTIEDPIEYVHPHKKSIVNQRELHGDTAGFAPALRAALREDPDVVLIGEMRDSETVETALHIAETGHLTLATLHTNSAVQTIHRIVDLFPARQQGQVRAQLSLILQGIVCQILIPLAEGLGRVPAAEVLIPTSGVRHLIREDKLHQVYSAMQSAKDVVGMQTMNQSLASLYRRRMITLDDAVGYSSNRDELRDMIARRRGGPGAGRTAEPPELVGGSGRR
jgi:twitching motility protein PilT